VTFGGVDIERRIIPSLSGKDRSQQEGFPYNLYPGFLSGLLNPHHSQIGVGAGEFEPELKSHQDLVSDF
jgi:hypothetical protein